MKRSFHSVDLPSIASFGQHAADDREEESSTLNKIDHIILPMKRRRAVSADSSFSTATTCRWCGGVDILPVDAASSGGEHHLESPATATSSQVVVAGVTPVSTSNLTVVDDVLLDRRPCLSSLSNDKSNRDAFPATAALECFMLQRRGSNLSTFLDDQDNGDCERESDGLAHQSSSSWQNFDREHELSSPRHVRDFPSEEDASIARSSFASFSCSPPSSLSHHEPPTVLWRKAVYTGCELVACCTAASPSLELHPTEGFSLKPRIDVNQLSEALARL